MHRRRGAGTTAIVSVTDSAPAQACGTDASDFAAPPSDPRAAPITAPGSRIGAGPTGRNPCLRLIGTRGRAAPPPDAPATVAIFDPAINVGRAPGGVVHDAPNGTWAAHRRLTDPYGPGNACTGHVAVSPVAV